jgi:hypothetical protein
MADVVDDDRALETGVVGDLTEGLLERAVHDLRPRPECGSVPYWPGEIGPARAVHGWMLARDRQG